MMAILLCIFTSKCFKFLRGKECEGHIATKKDVEIILQGKCMLQTTLVYRLWIRIASRDIAFLGFGPNILGPSNIANSQWYDVCGRDHVMVFGEAGGGDLDNYKHRIF